MSHANPASRNVVGRFFDQRAKEKQVCGSVVHCVSIPWHKVQQGLSASSEDGKKIPLGTR